MVSANAPRSRSLSTLDLAFLLLESDERMANVGPLAILRPPKGSRSAKAFADRLLRDLKMQPVASPFDLVYRPPGLQGMPALVPAAKVDIDAHCFRHTLPAPGTDDELFRFVCRLHEQRLDRSRPLWELHLIDGLERGRVALYMKIHHGMIDGRGMQVAFAQLFSDDPNDLEVHAPWQPAPEGGGSADAHAKRAASAARAPIVGAAASVASLVAALGRQALASAGLAKGFPLPFLRTPAAISGAASTQRCLAYCLLPLAAVRDFAKQHDAKVNDVLLTVLDMALHAYLGARGAKLLVADMPVALSGVSGGNALAILQLPLGAPAASPMQRLAQVQQHAAEVKDHVRHTDPAALVAYTALVHFVPAILELLGIRKGPVLANAVISNPGGYDHKRYIAGAELEVGLPMSVLAPGQALNITATTYDKSLEIAFLGLADALPDIDRLAKLTVEAFDELVAAAAPSAPKRRAPTRRKAAAAEPKPSPRRR